MPIRNINKKFFQAELEESERGTEYENEDENELGLKESDLESSSTASESTYPDYDESIYPYGNEEEPENCYRGDCYITEPYYDGVRAREWIDDDGFCEYCKWNSAYQESHAIYGHATCSFMRTNYCMFIDEGGEMNCEEYPDYKANITNLSDSVFNYASDSE